MVGGSGIWMDRLGIARQATRRVLELLDGEGPFDRCV